MFISNFNFCSRGRLCICRYSIRNNFSHVSHSQDTVCSILSYNFYLFIKYVLCTVHATYIHFTVNFHRKTPHLTVRKVIQNFRDITWNLVENMMILHELFRVVSRFPHYISYYVNRGKSISFGTVQSKFMHLLQIGTQHPFLIRTAPQRVISRPCRRYTPPLAM